MNEVEAFLAKQKRFRCERLNADLTLLQCDANRNRQAHLASGITKIIACENCPGLEGAADMSKIYDECSEPGCKRFAAENGKCLKHSGPIKKPARTEEEKKAMQAEKVRKMNEARKANAALKRQLADQNPAPVNDKSARAIPVKVKSEKPLPAMTQFAVDAGLVKEEVAREAIEHPKHYGGADNPYEAIKVIEAWELGFHLGNVIKYVSRAGKKGSDLEDLKKAQWYLQREIEKRAEA